MKLSIGLVFVCRFICIVAGNGKAKPKSPHIVVIIADDLGWNDVGFHGSNEISTPNIDALAYHGAILNRHYTQSTCTPSRAALLTAKYPIRTGLQGGPIRPGIPEGIPLKETLLPQYLKGLGYVTNLIGKWHVGYYNNESTPTNRGFDSFFGFYNGYVRYNDSAFGSIDNIGIDAWSNFTKAGDKFKGKHATDVYTDEAISTINKHDKTKPLFLDVSYSAPHAILNNVVQVKNEDQVNKKFAYITDVKRRLYAGCVHTLDESIGRIIQAMDKNDMLGNSIILFMADNGGPSRTSSPLTNAFENGASNWPLRGAKSTLGEGGVRGVAAIWSPYIQKHKVLNNKMHLVDWLPTFYAAAGGDQSKLKNIDGMSQWQYLTGAVSKPPREQILLNIDEKIGERGIIDGQWKYVIGKTKGRLLHYTGDSGRDKSLKYNANEILNNPTNRVLSKYTNEKLNEASVSEMRRKSTIDGECRKRIDASRTEQEKNSVCFPTGCLFNLQEDPCELVDQSGSRANIVKKLNDTLNTFYDKIVPQRNCTVDEKSYPKYHGGYHAPWVRGKPETCAD